MSFIIWRPPTNASQSDNLHKKKLSTGFTDYQSIWILLGSYQDLIRTKKSRFEVSVSTMILQKPPFLLPQIQTSKEIRPAIS